MTNNHDAVRVEKLNRDDWQQISATFCDNNFQQSWAYSEILASIRSSTHEEVAIRSAGRLVGIASVRVRTLPLIGLGLAYVASGPLIQRGTDGDLDRLRLSLAGLRDEFVRKRGLVLRILTPIGDSSWNDNANKVMIEAGFSPSTGGREYRTMLLDLHRPLDEIRKSLAQKWRNCLNKSERQGLQIRWASDISAFEAFRSAHERFVASKGFEVDLDSGFYLDVRKQSTPDTGLELVFAERDGQVIAAHLGSYLGDTAVYLLGFTDDTALETNAAYLLQWTVIKRATEAGMKWYDLGGIDPEGNPGVYRFKTGISGVDVKAAGPFEAAPTRVKHKLLQGIEKLGKVRSRTCKE